MSHSVRLTGVLLCVVMLVSLVIPAFCPTAYAAEAKSSVNVKVTYSQTDARATLDLINAFRTDTDGGAWYWNSDNATKTYYNTSAGNTLGALTYDYELEQVAIQRAAEIAVAFSHTRPNGEHCFSAYPTTSYAMLGENLAAAPASYTPEAVFLLLREDSENYSGQGHRRNMLLPEYTSVGIGHVIVNGRHYWAQAFGRTNTPAAATAAKNGAGTALVEVVTDSLTYNSLSCGQTDYSLTVGSTAPLPELTLYCGYPDHWPSGAGIPTVPDNVTWRTSDASVVTADGGIITARGAGSAVLTAQVGGLTAEVNCKVAALPTSSTTSTTSTTSTSSTPSTTSTTASTTSTTASSQGGVTVTRLAGDGRQATAAAISAETFTAAECVVLASGDNYADALAGVPLAVSLNAPILLVRSDGLDDTTLREIDRLGAAKVYILGGAGAVAESVENALRSGGYAVERIAGETRFETAVKIAERLTVISGSQPKAAFFVYSHNYPDALAISGIAAGMGAPILYVSEEGVPDSGTGELLASLAEKPELCIIGGYGVISSAADEKLAPYDSNGTAERIFGDNRYRTCVAINERFSEQFDGETMCAATGLNFPDALAGGVLACKKRAPLMLLGGMPSPEQVSYVKDYSPSEVYVFGGTNAVSDEELLALLPRQ